MNKAINTLVLATVDSITKFKNKFAYYLAIFAMVFGSTFGTLNSAYAADVDVVEGTTVTAADSTGDTGGAIVATDSLVISDGDVTINTEETLIEIAEIEADTGAVTVTLAGTGGLTTDTLTETGGVAFAITVNDANTLNLAGTSTVDGGSITIDLVDTATFAVTAAATNVADITADADGDGTVTFSAATTQSGTVGSVNLDIGTVNVNAATTVSGITHAKTVAVTAAADFSADLFVDAVSISGDTTTLTLGDKIGEATVDNGSTVTMGATGQKIILDGADDLSATLTVSTDGFGEIEITGDADMVGNIGTSTSVKVGLVDVNEDFDIENNVFADSMTIADTKEVTFQGAVDDTIVTAAIDGDAAGQGTVVITNSAAQANAIRFTGDLGTNKELAAVSLTGHADFAGSVTANEITVPTNKTGTFEGNITVGANDLTSTGTTVLGGSSTQTIQSGGAGEVIDGAGTVSITNTSNGGVIFDTILISDATLDVSIAASAKAVFTENAHIVEEISVAALGILELDDTIVSGDTVFTTTTDQDDVSFPATSKVKLPANLVGGQSITLLKTVKSAGWRC